MERRKTSLAGRHGPIFVLVVGEGGKLRPDVGEVPAESIWFNHTERQHFWGQLFGTRLQEELPASRILADVSVYCNTSIVRAAY